MNDCDNLPGRGLGRGGADDDDLVVAVASMIVMALAGCVSTRWHRQQAVLATPTALGAEGTAAAAPVAADWWRGFDDPVLADLITRATAGSPSLRVARARRARLGQRRSGRCQPRPQVAAASSMPRASSSARTVCIRRRSPALSAGPRRRSSTARGSSTSSAATGPSSTRRSVPSARASPTPTRRASCSPSTSPAPTSSWRARSRQRAVLERALAQRDEVFTLTQPARLVRPRHSPSSCARAKARDPRRDSRSRRSRNRSSSLRHALAAPPGRAAATLRDAGAEPVDAACRSRFRRRCRSISSAAAPTSSPRAGASRPRPAIAAVAAPQFYPNVNLIALRRAVQPRPRSARASEQRAVRHRPGDPPADLRRRTPARRPARAQRRPRRGGRDSYNGTLVDAIHDVADQISSTQSVERQQREQVAAQESAEAAYDLATQRYRAGIGGYITVLNAETNVIAQRRLTTDLRARAIDSADAAVRSLGGRLRRADRSARAGERRWRRFGRADCRAVLEDSGVPDRCPSLKKTHRCRRRAGERPAPAAATP